MFSIEKHILVLQHRGAQFSTKEYNTAQRSIIQPAPVVSSKKEFHAALRSNQQKEVNQLIAE